MYEIPPLLLMYMIGHNEGMCIKRKMFAVGAPANADYMNPLFVHLSFNQKIN